MQHEELIERVKAYFATPNNERSLQELTTLYNAITGEKSACTTCYFLAKVQKLMSFKSNPERYALRIQQAHIEMELATTTNYRFTKKATGTHIVLVDENGNTISITPETLTDERAELVLNNPRFAHNIERIPGTEPSEGGTEADAEQARLAAIEAEQKAEAERLANEQEEKAAAEAVKRLAELEAEHEAEQQRLATLAKEEAEKAAAEAEADRLAALETIKAIPVEELTIEQARIRYHVATGSKAGTRGLKTLQTAIKEAEEVK